MYYKIASTHNRSVLGIEVPRRQK